MINTLLNFGIPQGSNFSPILFTLYVSEINKCLGEMENVQVSLFADDQLLAISGRNGGRALTLPNDFGNGVTKIGNGVTKIMIVYAFFPLIFSIK